MSRAPAEVGGNRTALALHTLFQVTVHRPSHVMLKAGEVQKYVLCMLQQWKDTVQLVTSKT